MISRRIIFGSLLWLLTAIGAAFFVYSQRQGAPDQMAAVPGATGQLKRLGSQLGQPKMSFQKILAVDSQIERMRLLDEWIDGADAATLKRMLRQITEQPDANLEIVAQRKILARWLAIDPDSLWDSTASGEVDEVTLVGAWLHEGDVSDLWARIKSDEQAFFNLTMESCLKTYWSMLRPGEEELLQEVTGWSDEEMFRFRLAGMEHRADFDGLLELAEAYPDRVSDSWGFLDSSGYKTDPIGALEKVSLVPEAQQAYYLEVLAENWPSGIDAEVFVEQVKLVGDKAERGDILAAYFKRAGDDRETLGLLKRILNGEGELDRSAVLECLRVQSGSEIIREILPELEPGLKGWMRKQIATNWTDEIGDALNFSESLPPGHQRDQFLVSLFENQDFGGGDQMEGWLKEQSPEQIQRIGMAEYLSSPNSLEDCGQVVKLSQYLPVEQRREVLEGVVDWALEENLPLQAVQFLEENPVLAEPELVQKIYQNWSRFEPEPARAWAGENGIQTGGFGDDS